MARNNKHVLQKSLVGEGGGGGRGKGEGGAPKSAPPRPLFGEIE